MNAAADIVKDCSPVEAPCPHRPERYFTTWFFGPFPAENQETELEPQPETTLVWQLWIGCLDCHEEVGIYIPPAARARRIGPVGLSRPGRKKR